MLSFTYYLDLYPCILIHFTNSPYHIIFLKMFALSLIFDIYRADFASRVTWTRERSLQWWSSVSRSVVDNSWWINNLRMSQSTFMYICWQVAPYISKHATVMKEPVELERRVYSCHYMETSHQHRV